MKDSRKQSDNRRRKGFERAGGLLKNQIRRAGSSRGFAESRLLTEWHEIAGSKWAAICRPVKITYGRDGFGATLVLLTTGANAPMLQADLPKLRERVNSCYGYNAISHIRLAQTAETGFSEGRVQFDRPEVTKPKGVDPVLRQRAAETVGTVSDSKLGEALEKLGANILSKAQHRKGSSK